MKYFVILFNDFLDVFGEHYPVSNVQYGEQERKENP